VAARIPLTDMNLPQARQAPPAVISLKLIVA
jgi:hypothetical protein